MLAEVINKIESKNTRHSKKLKADFEGLDERFHEEANAFFSKYKHFASSVGKNFDYGVDAYLKVVSDTLMEQISFLKTGEYSCKSFKDANEKVYSNPEVMDYYMHGLLFTQFLWKHHYEILTFFRAVLPEHSTHISRYLEIGGGHGLYLSEAIKMLDAKTEFEMVDISESSLSMAKSFVNDSRVNYVHLDIYEHQKDGYYDFITMGEVLEHVEQPLDLMKQLNRLLMPGGLAFITAPTNAPMIDHISLFSTSDDIRDILEKSGFEIIRETEKYSENYPIEKLEKLKVPLMYAAIVKKHI